ncbi:Leucine-rich repeat-containing protein 75A [Acipenser ruthenus]|uniref:Leucine-rich repeat-containing protein 75A n=2 Tax=Acipenser ruthenus TaxID=7906 RepID=A0A444USL8_ACIRT|nr:Leucine-rich repeat-containing protein 75A [Acipenser ruthenus]
MDRLISYLQQNARLVTSVELCFTELTDEAFLQLLPTLSALPLLNTLSVNGNWLTKAVLRDIIDTLKDLEMFPSITWIDLGNNVDIFSLPQPFLVSLRKRCPKQGNLPTIMEFGESQVSDLENHDGNHSESLGDLDSEEEDLRENSLLFAGQSETDSVEKCISSVETGDHMTALAANQT